MNHKEQEVGIPKLAPPLESAVRAVVSDPIPDDAVKRVARRARGLADGDGGRSIREAAAGSPAEAAPAVLRTRTGSGPRWLRRHRKSVAVLCAVAAAIPLIVLFALQPSTSLAELLSHTMARKWIHGTTTWFPPAADKDPPPRNDSLAEDSETPVVFESWFSEELGIFALKLPQRFYYESRTDDAAIHYSLGSQTVVKTLPPPRNMKPPHHESLLELILDADKDKRVEAGLRVRDVRRKQIEVSGRAARQYDLRLTRPGDPTADQDVRLIVDEETQLVVSAETTCQDGARSVTRYDYPASGPTDIDALGIPETIPVIDRRASTDVRKVASTWTSARTRFDDYDAIFVECPKSLPHSVTKPLNATIKRVRRKGHRYRIDVLLKPMSEVPEPTKGTDMHRWWLENRDEYWFAPELICDGTTVTTYLLKDDRLPKDGKPNLQVKLRQQHGVQGYTTDPTVPWPQLMPEYACRPHLWTTIEAREFEYDPAPTDGPEGSVRLIVRKPEQTIRERHRYWLEPTKGFVATKVVQPVLDPQTQDVAFVDTEVFRQFQQSPDGFWYPTLSERSTDTIKGSQIRRYYVDFSVQLDDGLFQPLELKD